MKRYNARASSSDRVDKWVIGSLLGCTQSSEHFGTVEQDCPEILAAVGFACQQSTTGWSSPRAEARGKHFPFHIRAFKKPLYAVSYIKSQIRLLLHSEVKRAFISDICTLTLNLTPQNKDVYSTQTSKTILGEF